MDEPGRLFVYGTLVSAELVRELVGKSFPRKPGVLPDYEKVSPRRGYPYVVARPGGRVEGVVLFGVDAESLRIFDRYEGEGHLYERRVLPVLVEGRSLPCSVYVGRPEVLSRLWG
ncbi:MAG: hypothetical protein KatS3mg076_2778 [Candidatus Binatia bacterium]|nr:MAG: hypothetical protein KatS3mg076_2778 [Candidatus Binatia bacterium]